MGFFTSTYFADGRQVVVLKNETTLGCVSRDMRPNEKFIPVDCPADLNEISDGNSGDSALALGIAKDKLEEGEFIEKMELSWPVTEPSPLWTVVTNTRTFEIRLRD